MRTSGGAKIDGVDGGPTTSGSAVTVMSAVAVALVLV